MPLKTEFADAFAAVQKQLRDLNTRVLSQPAIVVDQAAAQSTDVTITVAQNADSGWQLLDGPSLAAVVTNAGTMLVTISGRIKVPGANPHSLGAISYQIKNAAGTVVVSPDLYRGVYVEYQGTGMGASAQSSFQYTHTGLTPGTYSIQTMHRYWDGPGSAAGPWTADFINRSLVARGY